MMENNYAAKNVSHEGASSPSYFVIAFFSFSASLFISSLLYFGLFESSRSRVRSSHEETLKEVLMQSQLPQKIVIPRLLGAKVTLISNSKLNWNAQDRSVIENTAEKINGKTYHRWTKKNLETYFRLNRGDYWGIKVSTDLAEEERQLNSMTLFVGSVLFFILFTFGSLLQWQRESLWQENSINRGHPHEVDESPNGKLLNQLASAEQTLVHIEQLTAEGTLAGFRRQPDLALNCLIKVNECTYRWREVSSKNKNYSVAFESEDISYQKAA